MVSKASWTRELKGIRGEVGTESRRKGAGDGSANFRIGKCLI